MVSELNIGSPEQNIDVIFRTDCTYTYITSNKHNISKPDQASEFIQLKYGNFKYFNEKESEHIYFYEKGYNFSRYAYNNKTYKMDLNEPHASLHGGREGLSTKIFSYEIKEDNGETTLIFNYLSKDLELIFTSWS